MIAQPADVRSAARPGRRRWLRRGAGAGLLALTGWLLLAFARLLGTSWPAVAGSLRHQVSLPELALLAVVWAVGLWCHSWVLTAALPGLSRRRALLLNLSGSAASDLIPFGGAAGAGLNLAMMRSWKISTARFATFTAISNLWNVLAKLALPAAVLTLGLAAGAISSPGLAALARLAVGLTVTLLTAAVVVIADGRIALAVGRAGDRVLNSVARRAGRTRRFDLARSLPAVRAEIAGVIRHGWIQLSAGVLGYLLLQGLLWDLSLRAIGPPPARMAVLAGFVVERILSMLPFTPGGAGVAEFGSAAVLISMGADPVTAAAGVVLYRCFAFLVEIPVGGVGFLAWWWRTRRSTRGAVGRPGSPA